ncbi:zinc finger BED domain-containing protein RICESLEEPER 2-like [Arachis hypogaea]|uniref:zinc finger BED domain-containing protein RICESLEEPER 2-like n=1 Tax=Arachis hypogaea TaxID=3818 RepID=UPI003B20EA21
MAESVTPSNPLANSISLNGEEINPSVPTMPTTDTDIAPTHTTTITNQPVTDEHGSNETIVTKKGRRLHQFGTILIKLKVLKVQKLFARWNLQKRILSFVQVPAPRRGIDVADAIFKCLKTWGIENKVFSVSVDNASYNDSCLRALKDTISDNNSLPVGGSLFHVRCCAHILNLLEREPHYNYEPSSEDWRKVEKIYKLLKVFNLATHVISGSEYPTANLYLPEVWRVKQVIDDAIEDRDSFMREMATSMKEKFDKYWGECNMVMSLACVLDPRCKLHVIKFCFPLIYKPEYVATENVEKVKNTLQEMYDEYAEKCHGETIISGVNTNSLIASSNVVSSEISGIDEMLNMVREKEAIHPTKSELEVYLDESAYIPEGNSKSFSALEWWKNNSLKFKVLSKMAADILAIPVSTVASESSFSAGGRVIDEYRSRLNQESIEALICGGDWLRNKYGLKKKPKVTGQAKANILYYRPGLLRLKPDLAWPVSTPTYWERPFCDLID